MRSRRGSEPSRGEIAESFGKIGDRAAQDGVGVAHRRLPVAPDQVRPGHAVRVEEDDEFGTVAKGSLGGGIAPRGQP
ncbi:hypothetical protein GCM10025867_31140 [Frondihabitans sucicola]|uniref:Uncharacterized protein n=1 Tax=Frondihabitans sucicola TaxID=1268041 RepID=A0ABM8GRE3_9MICO|nr:hypothetical protein GCM10025867_31140 [Frondihabitans sucicola]